MEEQFYRKPFIPSAVVRVILFLLGIIFIIIVFEGFGIFFYEKIFPDMDQRSPIFLTLTRGVTLIASLAFIWLMRTKVDRRPFLSKWLTITKRKFDLLVGFLAGGLLIGLASFILGRLGFIEFYPGQISVRTGLGYALLFFVAAFWEEIVFRGYIQENLMQGMHPFIALIITSVLFMLLHITNPSLDTIPILNLFLAGLMLGASFMYTKNLWFPQGLHWGWNLFQGPVFGYEVSGLGTESLFNQELLEDNIWTGGAFGFEGSILATVLILLATFVIIVQFSRFKKNENA